MRHGGVAKAKIGAAGLPRTFKGKVSGVGVSGDTSYTDRFVSWHVRHNLGFDHLAGIGVVPGADAAHPDNIIFDIAAIPNGGTGISRDGVGHPTYIANGTPAILPAVQQPVPGGGLARPVPPSVPREK